MLYKDHHCYYLKELCILACDLLVPVDAEEVAALPGPLLRLYEGRAPGPGVVSPSGTLHLVT